MEINFSNSQLDNGEFRMVLIDISQYNIDKAYADAIKHTDGDVIILQY